MDNDLEEKFLAGEERFDNDVIQSTVRDYVNRWIDQQQALIEPVYRPIDNTTFIYEGLYHLPLHWKLMFLLAIIVDGVWIFIDDDIIDIVAPIVIFTWLLFLLWIMFQYRRVQTFLSSVLWGIMFTILLGFIIYHIIHKQTDEESRLLSANYILTLNIIRIVLFIGFSLYTFTFPLYDIQTQLNNYVIPVAQPRFFDMFSPPGI